jgi:hypothetical protein
MRSSGGGDPLQPVADRFQASHRAVPRHAQPNPKSSNSPPPGPESASAGKFQFRSSSAGLPTALTAASFHLPSPLTVDPALISRTSLYDLARQEPYLCVEATLQNWSEVIAQSTNRIRSQFACTVGESCTKKGRASNDSPVPILLQS